MLFFRCNVFEWSGLLFSPSQGDVWICMELMDCSLDKLYQIVFNVIKERIPELVLGKIAESVSPVQRYEPGKGDQSW